VQFAENEQERFLREARAIALLTHPHIARVLDFGVQDGVPYLVMEYAPNGSLLQRFPPGKQFPPEVILPYVEQAADALQYAHAHQLIHGDIKPDNLLLGRNGEVLLGGFHITLGLPGSSSQRVQDLTGTPAYMAPEQLQGKPRTASDLYSLGIAVYEWLSGERPFLGSFTEVAGQQMFAPPPPLQAKVPGISPELEQVVLIALKKDPKERFATVQAFARAFGLACQNAPLGSTLAQPLSFPGALTPPPQPTHAVSPGIQQMDPPSSSSGAGTPPAPGYSGWSSRPPLPVQLPSFPPPSPPRRARGFNPLGGIIGGVGELVGGVRERLTTRRQPHPASTQPSRPVPVTPPAGIPQIVPRPATGEETPPQAAVPQFTAFYPKEVAVEAWNTLLVYIHVASALEEVRADALRVAPELEGQREVSDEAPRPVARGTEMMIVPHCEGITFNPPSISLKWLRDQHRAQFDFLVSKNYSGRAGNGEITIFVGPLIIGTIPFALLFETRSIPKPDPVPAVGRLYQHIFASYSHRDTPVVQACRNAYKSLGWNVLIDSDTLRSGQVWNEALMRMIDHADIFQLFWSAQAAQSEYVRQEWEYALDHSKGEGFIRPVYWELPLVPPPPRLKELHFAYQPLPTLGEPASH
jgi:serine/threonine protein kinase